MWPVLLAVTAAQLASRVLKVEDCAPTLRVHSSGEERRGSGAQLSCRWRRGGEPPERWSYKWGD